MNVPNRPDPELVRNPRRTLIDMAIVLGIIAIAVAVLVILILTGQ